MDTTTKKLEDFKFKNNITTILEKKLHIITKAMDDEGCEYYISGGFALALLIAPRTRDYTYSPISEDFILSIEKTYYDDIDLFFPSELDFYKAKSCLERYGQLQYENEKQSTYMCYGEKIQLVKHEFGTPEQIMQNFDTINCCIFFTKNSEVITHRDFYKSLLTKELVLNKMKFTEIEDEQEFKKYAAIIVERIVKYTSRYNWTLNKKLKDYIQAVVNFYPQVVFEETQVLYGNSSSFRIVSKKNQWERLAQLGIAIPSKSKECQQDT